MTRSKDRFAALQNYRRIEIYPRDIPMRVCPQRCTWNISRHRIDKISRTPTHERCLHENENSAKRLQLAVDLSPDSDRRIGLWQKS
jgi:hypothetical protein